MRMPHVFVIPPEEEQHDNPPWCCFDADERPENNGDFPSDPDIHLLDVPYLSQPSDHDTPASLSRHTSINQQRQRPLLSRKLEKRQRPEAITIIESKSSQGRKRDSDVIEVIKVKRMREPPADLEENTKVKRSKTLKARATKALQSIKNVGTAPHRTHVRDLWTSSETIPGIFKGVQEQVCSQQDQTEHHPHPPAPPKKGPLSRANSRSLSQIFAKSLRSGSTSTVHIASSSAPDEVHRISPSANPSLFSDPRYNSTNPSLSEVPIMLTSNDTLDRLVPRFPSTKKNANRKFSVRELHRLFSFSSPSPDGSSSQPAATAVPFAPASNRSMPSTSTVPPDCPDLPMTESVHADTLFLNLENAGQKLASQYHQGFHARRDVGFSNSSHLSDLNFEMKLDSLHFDSLSFDPEDFDVPMEGSSPR